jgi:hypothetical protein
MTKVLFKSITQQVLTLRVSHKILNWITEQSGFDWLYDYEFKSPRVLTVEAFITNCEEPTEDFKAFCKEIKVRALREPAGTGMLIMFEPPKK